MEGTHLRVCRDGFDGTGDPMSTSFNLNIKMHYRTSDPIVHHQNRHGSLDETSRVTKRGDNTAASLSGPSRTPPASLLLSTYSSS